jgi:hypothetical protein
MEETGEKPTDYSAKIVIDVTGDSFMVSHTSNIEMDQIYVIFAAALDYMDTLVEEPPKFLN